MSKADKPLVWLKGEIKTPLLSRHRRGSKGGARITYSNVGRYLDNTNFIALVANAWVGTTVKQSEILETAIRATLESGKAVALAVKTDIQPAAGISADDIDGEE